MAEYGQFCPVAKTAERFAERWTPLIIREWCCGPAQFNGLKKRLPLMSKTLLAQRLRDIEHTGMISMAEKESGSGYIDGLTEAREEFRPIIEMMSLWGQRHTRSMRSAGCVRPCFPFDDHPEPNFKVELPGRALLFRSEEFAEV